MRNSYPNAPYYSPNEEVNGKKYCKFCGERLEEIRINIAPRYNEYTGNKIIETDIYAQCSKDISHVRIFLRRERKEYERQDSES